jgi:hypothetical protein
LHELPSHADILPVCAACHQPVAKLLGREIHRLAACYHAPERGFPWIDRPQWTRVRKAAKKLQNPIAVQYLTSKEQDELGQMIDEWAGAPGAWKNDSVLQKALLLPDAEKGVGFTEHGQEVVSRVLEMRRLFWKQQEHSERWNLLRDPLTEFIYRWRQFFLDTFRPIWMSPNYRVDLPICNCPGQPASCLQDVHVLRQ